MDKIKVIIKDDQKTIKVPTGLRMIIRRSCNAALQSEKFVGPAEINVMFVDNESIRKLNKKFRNIDKETDVLSFPLGNDGVYDKNPSTNASMLGDIVISLEKAFEQANIYGHSIQREIAFLTTHSVLHLLGYDHESGGMDKVHMREKEEEIMNQLGLPSTTSYVLNEK